MDTHRKKKRKPAPKQKERRSQRSSFDNEEIFQNTSQYRLEDDLHDSRHKRNGRFTNRHYEDDDDDDNVLVEEDDDLSFDDESDLDDSTGSYTCVKNEFPGDLSTDYDQTTLPKNRLLLNGPDLNSSSYTDALKHYSVHTSDNNEQLELVSTVSGAADPDTKAATVPVSVTTLSSTVVFKTTSPSDKSSTSSEAAHNTVPALLKPSIIKDSKSNGSCGSSNSKTGFNARTFQDHHQRSQSYDFLYNRQQQDHCDQIVKSTSEKTEAADDHPLNQQCNETGSHHLPLNQNVNHGSDKSPCNHSNGPYPSISQDSDAEREITEEHSDEANRRVAVTIETDTVNSTVVRDRDIDSGIFSTKRGCEDSLEENLPLKQIGSSENSLDRISEQSYSLHDIQVQHVVGELTREDLSRTAHFRSIIYLLALSFHGIFEGMALGLQSMKSSVWALCFAIVVHRCVLAFKLGMDLCRGEEKQGTSFLCIGTFTLISTLGIIVGILISSGASLYSDVTVPEAILQSLATGTILYIVFLGILFNDLQGHDDLKRVSSFFVGFSLMAVVFAVTES